MFIEFSETDPDAIGAAEFAIWCSKAWLGNDRPAMELEGRFFWREKQVNWWERGKGRGERG